MQPLFFSPSYPHHLLTQPRADCSWSWYKMYPSWYWPVCHSLFAFSLCPSALPSHMVSLCFSHGSLTMWRSNKKIKERAAVLTVIQNYVLHSSVSSLVRPLLDRCAFVPCCCGQGQCHLLARTCIQGRLILASERMRWPNLQWTAKLSQQCKIIIKKEKEKKREKNTSHRFLESSASLLEVSL